MFISTAEQKHLEQLRAEATKAAGVEAKRAELEAERRNLKTRLAWIDRTIGPEPDPRDEEERGRW